MVLLEKRVIQCGGEKLETGNYFPKFSRRSKVIFGKTKSMVLALF